MVVRINWFIISHGIDLRAVLQGASPVPQKGAKSTQKTSKIFKRNFNQSLFSWYAHVFKCCYPIGPWEGKKIIYNHCMCTVCARLKGVFWAPFHEMGFILHLQQLPKPTYVVVMRYLAQTHMCVKICKELGHQYLAQQRKNRCQRLLICWMQKIWITKLER